MYEHPRRDKIRNENIRDKMEVTSMVDKMTEVKLDGSSI